MLKEFINKLLYVVFPNKCIFCSSVINENYFVCEDCLKQINIEPSFKAGNKYVSTCVYSFYYVGNIKNAIWRFKFRNKTSYTKALASFMLEGYKKYLSKESFDYIIPIPITQKRKKERGYNQAELLAQELSVLTGVPCKTDILIKAKDCKDQHNLKSSEREANVKGVFSVQNPSELKGMKILLVDDIVTTGHTLSEAAKTLKKAKTSKVSAIVVASAKRSPLVKF